MTVALARSTDPDTSHEAAAKISTENLVERVYITLYCEGPMTAPEIARHLGIREGSITPRMKPMREEGLIERTGERRNGAYVYRAVV